MTGPPATLPPTQSAPLQLASDTAPQLEVVCNRCVTIDRSRATSCESCDLNINKLRIINILRGFESRPAHHGRKYVATPFWIGASWRAVWPRSISACAMGGPRQMSRADDFSIPLV